MSTLTPSTNKLAMEPVPNSLHGNAPLPVFRTPMLDSGRQLFAYEIVFPAITEEQEDLPQRVLSTITDGALTRLARGNRAFINLPPDLLLEDSDVLLHQPRLGVVLQPAVANDPAQMKLVKQMAQRGCQIMVDISDAPLGDSLAVEALLQAAQFVRLNADQLSPAAMQDRSTEFHARGLGVIAGQVNGHDTYERCLELPVQAIQGRYLLMPQPVEVPVLSANRLSMMRLMAVLDQDNPGPVEMGKIVRDDAVLSYKLLSCVNSAYFALPRQLKSIEQAAIFFGATRMRNWINAMLICGMDDRPPELLRAALIRANMCEKLAVGMPRGDSEMAFTVGLFSLLDTLMSAPLEFLLYQLRLAPEISDALVHRSGPFGELLEQVLAWEAGKLNRENMLPQRIQRLAAIYLESAHWADEVFANANSQADS